MQIHVDDKTLAQMYKLQRNAAMDDVAALTAAVQSLQLENARLRGPKAVDAAARVPEVPAKTGDEIMDERIS